MARPKSKEIESIDTSKIIMTTDPLREGIKLIERDSYGLIKGVEYLFDENGNVNWRKMVPLKFLYLNTSDKYRKEALEKKYKKPATNIDIVADNVEDKDLVITLAGLKHLLRLRGYRSVSFCPKETNERFASVNCNIEFIPNFETEGSSQFYSEVGSAHLQSTDGFMRAYLVEAATNRSFARCIRNYLNINIVSREELFDQSKAGNIEANPAPVTNGSAYSILESKCSEKGWNLEKVKKAAINYKNLLQTDPANWNVWADIAATDAYVLLGKINESSSK